MYSIDEIKELLKAVDESGIAELEVTGEDHSGVVIRKESKTVAQQAPAPPVQVAAPTERSQPEEQAETPRADTTGASTDENAEKITSPMVGTFYRGPSPDADSYVQVGDRIGESSVVCIVEAMKLMNEIEAETEGEIIEILVENGELVDYGQPLFLVKTG
ncbi:acetyl-CoA carboxylase biotin carboxyl carrier protein [Natribacillus halophilus]|uniref:Biotin carboxyl carrier protein of acetyl-CoA carboxylase n=1 Tax=Natribacillus halophilus TaxID=549003 RepID=A0A1G8LKC6_9BACI|nr:acetyl-CoA carboxylase biotin carboxyl carrier protein [Natribacillus halophilus]SDI55680.1 biotin carboxyl carrier protein [Natribacillus halophilus]